MPSTTLPAPEIKIGSRLPVTFSLPRNCPVKCELVHKWPKKIWENLGKFREEELSRLAGHSGAIGLNN
jgi:hypothetical protein